MTSLNVLLQSDYFVQLVALGSVILMGLLTYVFGYKSSSSNIDQEILNIEVKETKKQKIEKAKKAEVKDKKKPKATATPATPAPETRQELEKPVATAATKKPEPVKVPSPKPTPKAVKNKNAKVEDVKPVVAAVMPEEDGWTTVTDKKQKKTASAVVAETVKETKPTVAVETVKETKPIAAVEKKVIEVVEAVQQKEEDSWKTVTDKRQKKNSETKSESLSPVAESKKSKKAKKMAEIEASAVKVPVTAAPAAVVAEETKPVVVEEESEWKTANSKAIKKKSKTVPVVVEASKSVEVKKVEAPVVPEVIAASPKSDKKSKKSKPVKEEPVQVPQAIQELITAQLTSPNSIAAAIIEQFKNDKNNNTIVSEKVVAEKVEPELVVAKKVVTSAAKANKAGKSQILKTTNLTESMVLIESDGKSNSRTDSNPSSSESLQDLDVGDGWATITSKKKRTVRREV